MMGREFMQWHILNGMAANGHLGDRVARGPRHSVGDHRLSTEVAKSYPMGANGTVYRQGLNCAESTMWKCLDRYHASYAEEVPKNGLACSKDNNSSI